MPIVCAVVKSLPDVDGAASAGTVITKLDLAGMGEEEDSNA